MQRTTLVRAGVAVIGVPALILGLTTAPAVANPRAERSGVAAAADPSGLPWMDSSLSPDARADLLIAAMTLDQKIQQIGNLPEPNTISGTYLAEGNVQSTCEFTDLGRHISGIPELAIPTMREVNAGNGIRGGDCAREPVKTAGPSMTLLGAAFDRAAATGWGEVVGSETKTYAHQVLLGPGMNLIRNPYAGRAQEYPSEDPFLAGSIASAQIKGIQSQGTQVQMKHFLANENEYYQERWTVSERIPSRAMHELYLLPFEMAIKDADPASAMCSYPMVNYRWSCDSQDTLRTIVRDQWGYKGWIESDRSAMHSTVRALDAGVGWELDWQPKYYSAENIKANIAAGQIREVDLDRVLRPRYVKMFEFGNFDNPAESFGVDDLDANAAKARAAAESGIVLLKNEKGLLPLKGDVKSIALIGPDWFAGQATLPPRSIHPDENTGVVAPYTVTPLQGIQSELDRLGSKATVTYNDGTNMDSAVELAKNSDVVIMMLGTNPREMNDLEKTNLPVINGVNQHDLAWAVSKANPQNVVVLKTAAGVTMNWAPRARAIVAAWFPGQDDGDVVAGVLFGRINPSGKTPVSWPVTDKEAAFSTVEQYPGTYQNTGVNGGKGRNPKPGQPQLVVEYNENLSMGYRWYEQNAVKPQFAFGHGLSYTTFEYSRLRVKPKYEDHRSRVSMEVTFTLKNTGAVAGKEVPQLYLTLPEVAAEPSKRLVGFDKIELQPGESKQVTLTVDSAAPNHPFGYFVPASEDLFEWAHGTWLNASGGYTVHVGGGSDSTPLERNINLRFKD